MDKLLDITVKINNGSGCLISLLSGEFTYILTASHVIKDDNGNLLDKKEIKITRQSLDTNNKLEEEYFEILDDIYSHSDNKKDAAIIKIKKIDNLPSLTKATDNEIYNNNFYLCGYPDTRKDLVKSSESTEKITFGFRANEVKILNKREMGYLEGETINKAIYKEIIGQSGGGIIRAYDGLFILAGIQKGMIVPDEEILGRIEIIPISFFEEIVQENNILPLSFSQKSTYSSQNIPEKNIERYKIASKKLLEINSPSDITKFFPELNKNILKSLDSLKKVKRILTKKNEENGDFKNIFLEELILQNEEKTLILSPGGSGKTFSLWKLAEQIFQENLNFIPIFVTLRDFNSAEEVINHILDSLSITDDALKNSLPFIFIFDGWSEFPKNSSIINDSERKKLLSKFINYRIIANGRYESEYDHRFNKWNLEKISESTVKESLKIGLPEIKYNDEKLNSLLNYPLFLNLYLCLGGNSSSKGQLIQEFHKNISKDIDKKFFICLTETCALTQFSEQKFKRNNFEKLLEKKCREVDINNPQILLEKLGVFGNRADIIQPIHDLYWEWLVGCGIIENWNYFKHISTIKKSSRDYIKLALESGFNISLEEIYNLHKVDLLFTSLFLKFSINDYDIFLKVITEIKKLLNSQSYVDVFRGVIASLLTENNDIFDLALNKLEELCQKNFHFPDLYKIVEKIDLWEKRNLINDWLNPNLKSKDYILHSIKKSWDPKWSEWIKNLFNQKKLDIKSIIEIFFSCNNTLPEWLKNELEVLLNNKDLPAYYLKPASERGDNNELAQWVTENYEKFIISNQSNFYTLNNIIKNSNNEKLFSFLLDNFINYDLRTQEVLSHLFENLGEDWIVKLQTIILENHIEKDLSYFFEHISKKFPERKLHLCKENPEYRIKFFAYESLALKKQEEFIPHLIKDLPETFSEHDFIPALRAFLCIENLPESLIDILWNKFNGTIQPSVSNDFIKVISKITPMGLPTIVNMLKVTPLSLPAYQLKTFFECYTEYKTKTGLKILTKSEYGELDFHELILLKNILFDKYHKDDEYYFIDMCTNYGNDKLVKILINEYKKGNKRISRYIKAMKGIPHFDRDIVKSLLYEKEKNIEEFLLLFSNSINLFPSEDAIKVLKIIKEKIPREDFIKMLKEVSLKQKSIFDSFSSEIIEYTLNLPEEKIHDYRALANFLSNFKETKLKQLFFTYLNTKVYHEKIKWVIRYLEENTNNLFLNENNKLI